MITTINGYFAPKKANDAEPVWSPMINLGIAAFSQRNDTPLLQSSLIALLDTGADACHIDSGLVTKYQLPVYANGKNTTVNGTSDSFIYRLDLVLGDASRIHTPVFGSPLRSQGFQFDVLIGMVAISYFELTVDRTKSQVTLRRSS